MLLRLALAVAIPALPAAAQQPPILPDEVTKPMPRALGIPGSTEDAQLSMQDRLDQIARLEKEIQGAWIMHRFLPPGSHEPVEPARGLMVFNDGYMAMVIHAVDNTMIEDEELYQSAVVHYRIDENIRLQTSTILGHSNFSGNFDFEPQWLPREFEILIFEQMMVLERPDGARLQFQRASGADFPRSSFEALDLERGIVDADQDAEDFLKKADLQERGPNDVLVDPAQRKAEEEARAEEEEDDSRADPPEPPGPFLDRERGPLLPDGPLLGIRNRRAQAQGLAREISGAWRLVRVVDIDNPVPAPGLQGFALIADGYIGLVIEADLIAGPMIQAGVHHFRFSQAMRLQTSTVIGHSNFNEEFEFETAGDVREFELTVAGNTLTLLRPNGSRLLFQRAANSVFPEKTISLIRQARIERGLEAPEPSPVPEGEPEVTPTTIQPSPLGSTNRQE